MDCFFYLFQQDEFFFFFWSSRSIDSFSWPPLRLVLYQYGLSSPAWPHPATLPSFPRTMVSLSSTWFLLPRLLPHPRESHAEPLAFSLHPVRWPLSGNVDIVATLSLLFQHPILFLHHFTFIQVPCPFHLHSTFFTATCPLVQQEPYLFSSSLSFWSFFFPERRFLCQHLAFHYFFIFFFQAPSLVFQHLTFLSTVFFFSTQTVFQEPTLLFQPIFLSSLFYPLVYFFPVPCNIFPSAFIEESYTCNANCR